MDLYASDLENEAPPADQQVQSELFHTYIHMALDCDSDEGSEEAEFLYRGADEVLRKLIDGEDS